MRKRIIGLSLMFVAMLFTTSSYGALPPKPGAGAETSLWISYGIAAVLFAGVCVAALRGSKRSHLD